MWVKGYIPGCLQSWIRISGYEPDTAFKWGPASGACDNWMPQYSFPNRNTLMYPLYHSVSLWEQTSSSPPQSLGPEGVICASPCDNQHLPRSVLKTSQNFSVPHCWFWNAESSSNSTSLPSLCLLAEEQTCLTQCTCQAWGRHIMSSGQCPKHTIRQRHDVHGASLRKHSVCWEIITPSHGCFPLSFPLAVLSSMTLWSVWPPREHRSAIPFPVPGTPGLHCDFWAESKQKPSSNSSAPTDGAH